MTKRVSFVRLTCPLGERTWGSEPSHNFPPMGAGFGRLNFLEKGFLPMIGERGVVGVVGLGGSLGDSSGVWGSGGGDGLWRSCLNINLGISSSASRSRTPISFECELPSGDQEWIICKPVEGSLWRRRGEDLTRLRGAGPRYRGRSILSRTKALLNMERMGWGQP